MPLQSSKTKPLITIRIGAAHWGATLPDGTSFDFASMTATERKRWYRSFGDVVWSLYGHNVKGHALPGAAHQGGRQ